MYSFNQLLASCIISHLKEIAADAARGSLSVAYFVF